MLLVPDTPFRFRLSLAVSDASPCDGSDRSNAANSITGISSLGHLHPACIYEQVHRSCTANSLRCSALCPPLGSVTSWRRLSGARRSTNGKSTPIDGHEYRSGGHRHREDRDDLYFRCLHHAFDLKHRRGPGGRCRERVKRRAFKPILHEESCQAKHVCENSNGKASDCSS